MKGKIGLTNLANYSNPDYIGSNHWLRTLMGQSRRIGEFLEKNETIHPVIQKEYGKLLKAISDDIMNWRTWLDKQPKT